MTAKARFAAPLAALAQCFTAPRGDSSRATLAHLVDSSRTTLAHLVDSSRATLAHLSISPCAALAHRVAAFAFAATLLVLSGCSGGCSREKTPEPVLDRIEDPAYVKQLKECITAQHELAVRGSKILRELEAARAEDPNSEKTKKLEKRYAKNSADLEKLRTASMAIVRDRKNKEEADRAKAAADAKEKK